jgi:threonine aldolase
MSPQPPPNGVELRSDTFTRPTPSMRTAMADAVVGDDVWGEDPTVKELEARVAALTGKEAALFVPSGTASNLIAILTHVQRRGGFIVVGDQAHIYVYEQQGAATVGGVGIVTVPNTDDGCLSLPALQAALDVPDDPHFAAPALVCIEQTHNRCGGSVISVDHLQAVAAAAHKAGIPVHMDGARLANAAAVLGSGGNDAAPWALACTGADTVSVCLSKGLGAPVGSCLAGPAAFIQAARRTRKVLGGGMRQAGVLAAPALVAVDAWRRLSDDHALARALADGLAAIPGLTVRPVATNIVIFGPADDAPASLTATALVAGLASRGVRVAAFRGAVRAVTSCEVDGEGIDQAIKAAAAVVTDAKAGKLGSGDGATAY